MIGGLPQSASMNAAILRQRQGALAQRSLPLRSRFIPSPVGGLNARDSIDDMPETDAIVLKNFYPEPGRVKLRKGYAEHATGVGSGAVETLLEFRSGTTSKLLAASSSTIYDATSSGSASAIASTLSNGQWYGVMMNGKLGLCNGEDAVLEYDGSTASTMTISGPTSANIIGMHVHGNRSWFWEINDDSVWYSALGAFGGTLTELDISQYAQSGGAVYNVVSWTKDGGAGPDDFICFVMSTGEVLVYAFDPGFNLAIVGRFQIGPPVSRRGAIKLAGDVLILTKDGVQSLAGALAQSRLNLPTASAAGLPTNLSSKISRIVLKQIDDTGATYGWQPLHYPKGRYLLVNYPTTSAGAFEQYVLNLDTGAWCQFDSMNASAWSLLNDVPYFGGQDGKVYKADTGTSDGSNPIRGQARTAFTYLGNRGRRKTVKMINPVLSLDGEISVNVGIASDFDPNVSSPATVYGAGSMGATWDSAAWDSAMWGTGEGPVSKWLPRSANGFAIATNLVAQTSVQSLAWLSTGYAYQVGGVE